MTMPDSEVISIRIPEKMLEKMDSMMEEYYLTRGEFIRAAVNNMLKEYDLPHTSTSPTVTDIQASSDTKITPSSVSVSDEKADDYSLDDPDIEAAMAKIKKLKENIDKL